MDYARSTPTRLRLVSTSTGTSVVAKPHRLGHPGLGMPGVRCRELDRKFSLDDVFPIVILTGFALLAGIQALLLQ